MTGSRFWRTGRIVERNAANRDFQVVLDLLFDFARAVPMRERKATVDLRLGGILRREEVVEFFLRIDHARVARRETACARSSRFCWMESSSSAARLDELRDRQKLFRFDRLIAPAHRHGA